MRHFRKRSSKVSGSVLSSYLHSVLQTSQRSSGAINPHSRFNHYNRYQLVSLNSGEHCQLIKNRISPTYKALTSNPQCFNSNSHTKRFNTGQKFSQSQERNRHCTLCDKNNHYNDECKRYPTASSRFQRLKEITNNHFCNKCLFSDHRISNCQKQSRCFYCKGNHHRALCFQKFPDTNSNANIASEFSTITLQSVESNGPITTL